jgi:hypothetical protein
MSENEWLIVPVKSKDSQLRTTQNLPVLTEEAVFAWTS